MVIDKTAFDSNRDWRRAYENVVTAIGRRYKKYGVRMIAVENGEGTSERTKFNELLQRINMINEIGVIALSVGDFGKKLLNPVVGSREIDSMDDRACESLPRLIRHD
jgi:hypothetical protein